MLIPVIALTVIIISIVIMVIKAKKFKKTIKDTVDYKKNLEETITAKAKAKLEEEIKVNDNLTCEYCGTAYDKGDKKCPSCGATLKRR